MSQTTVSPSNSAAVPVLFSELRRDNFFSLRPELKKDIDYVEQLASQTSTDISNWNVTELLDGIQFGDKRAINKRFFAKSGEQTKTESTLSSDVVSELEKTSNVMAAAAKRKKDELEANILSRQKDALYHFKEADKHINRAWVSQKEILAIEQRPANYIAEEVKKLLAEGFWKFHGFTHGNLVLTTAQNVVMTNINATAGVNERAMLGKYRGILNLNRMQISVQRFQQNLTTPGRFFHPYVAEDGTICWGSAAETVARKLSYGEVYDVYSLLAALLTTYSTGTPWESLRTFAAMPEDQRKNYDQAGYDGEHVWCDECQLERMRCDCGDWCQDCDHHYDDCECESCDVCETRYPVGGRRRCDCCMDCMHSECTCCSICGSSYNDECGCCQDCNSTQDECTYCGECGHHCDVDQDHSSNCSSYVAPATTG